MLQHANTSLQNCEDDEYDALKNGVLKTKYIVNFLELVLGRSSSLDPSCQTISIDKSSSQYILASLTD
jgi:hypothetical protein